MEGVAACDSLPDENSLQEYVSSLSSLHAIGVDEVEVRLMQAMHTHTQLMTELERLREDTEQRSLEELERLLREQTMCDKIHAENEAYLNQIKMELKRVEAAKEDGSNFLMEISNLKGEMSRLLKGGDAVLKRINAKIVGISKLKKSIENLEMKSSFEIMKTEKEEETVREVQKMLEKLKELLNSTNQNQALIKARISAAKEAILKSEKAISEDQKLLKSKQDELGKIKHIRIFLDAARETAKGSKGLALERSQSRAERLKAELAEAEAESESKLRSITMLEADLVADEDTNNQLQQLLQDLSHVWEAGNRPVSDKTCQTDF